MRYCPFARRYSTEQQVSEEGSVGQLLSLLSNASENRIPHVEGTRLGMILGGGVFVAVGVEVDVEVGVRVGVAVGVCVGVGVGLRNGMELQASEAKKRLPNKIKQTPRVLIGWFLISVCASFHPSDVC
jgi:hypothetical protein